MKVKQLLGDKVLVEKVKDSPTSKGGLYIPDNVKETMFVGKIISVGEGVKSSSIKIGSIISFQKHAWFPYTLTGEEIGLMEEKNVIAILEV
jgi:chaperonin GroES